MNKQIGEWFDKKPTKKSIGVMKYAYGLIYFDTRFENTKAIVPYWRARYIQGNLYAWWAAKQLTIWYDHITADMDQETWIKYATDLAKKNLATAKEDPFFGKEEHIKPFAKSTAKKIKRIQTEYGPYWEYKNKLKEAKDHIDLYLPRELLILQRGPGWRMYVDKAVAYFDKLELGN
jgi:hypothetical protein